jgi:hypothetical protein
MRVNSLSIFNRNLKINRLLLLEFMIVGKIQMGKYLKALQLLLDLL